MKKIILALALSYTLILGAAEQKIDVSFDRISQNGMPSLWVNNTWDGYRPFAKYQVFEENGSNVIHFTEIKGKRGVLWGTIQRFPAKAGDKFILTAKVKGNGNASFGLQTLDAAGKWTGTYSSSQIPLTPEWKEISVELPVKDFGAKETGKVLLTFGAEKHADFYISSIRAQQPAN